MEARDTKSPKLAESRPEPRRRNEILIFIIEREKGRDLTKSSDKSPYTNRKLQKGTWQHKKVTKNFDYTTTVSCCSSSQPTGVVKPVYERSTFPLTATAV